jgi:hypothetical protein
MKVQSHNNDAEFGNVLGAVVNVVTKSGTNKFHGSAWEFARSQIFDARNPFTGFCTPANCVAQANKLQSQVTAGTLTASAASSILSGTPVSPLGYQENMYGGTFGGTIIKKQDILLFRIRSLAVRAAAECLRERAHRAGTGRRFQRHDDAGIDRRGQFDQDRNHAKPDFQPLRRSGREFGRALRL